MARSVSNAKIFSAFLVDRFSVASSRRGYAAAAASRGILSGREGAARSNVMMKKAGEESTSKANSWVPDPVTGYYRPENQTKEIDAAELREMLLKHKN